MSVSLKSTRERRTSLCFLISRMSEWKASLTLVECLADVPMKSVHPRCFARSRPSVQLISPSIHRRANPTNGIVDGGRVGAIASSLTVPVHLALVVAITLVPDEQNRDITLVLDPKDLLMKAVGFLERFPGGYRVHEEKPFSEAQVLIPRVST
jgi:hypothetical protein